MAGDTTSAGGRRWSSHTVGKNIRMARMFHRPSGGTVIVALDHALDHGHLQGLHDMAGILEQMALCPPDGLIVRPATLKRYGALLSRRGGPALIVALDSRMTSTVPGGEPMGEEHLLVSTVEEALALGADAVKILLIFGRKDVHVHAANVKRVAAVIAEADRVGVPVMVETVLWGLNIAPEDQNDPALLPHICRIGVELGADMIKAAYAPGVYPTLTAELPVPVVVLGGGFVSWSETEEMVRRAVDDGVAGVAIGRNVFQAPSPSEAVARLQTIVYGN